MNLNVSTSIDGLAAPLVVVGLVGKIELSVFTPLKETPDVDVFKVSEISPKEEP